jgi:phage head maturation protease
MSFGFVAGAGNSKVEQRGGKPHRSLTGFKRLLDVSPTWDPAYTGTSAELRSLRALQIAEDIEQTSSTRHGCSRVRFHR